jgi:hypothetical protein
MGRRGIRVNVRMILPKLIGGALAAVLLLASAARADVLDPVDGVHIAASDGARIWNHTDGAGNYTLVDAAGTQLVAPSVQNRPFDVSFGTDDDGRLLAVYSRCSDDGVCPLYAYDVDAESEMPLGVHGVFPSLSQGVLAFTHGHDVYQGRLGAKPHRIAHMRGTDNYVSGIAASERGVAFTTHSEIRGSAMYFKPAGGGAVRRLARSHRDHMSPVWHDGRLYWAFSNHEEFAHPNGWVIRYSVTSGRAKAFRVTPGFVDSIAFDGPTLITSVYLDSHQQGPGQVATVDSPQWQSAPRSAGLGR